jgi:opacity protein-like surface antigen
MRFKHVMLSGIALLAFTAAPASAQWFVTPYAGGNFGGDTTNTRFDVGAGVGFLGGGVFGFEADFNYAPNFFDSSNNINFNTKNSSLSTVMLDLMAAAPVHAGFRPYGSGGVGWMKSRVNTVDQAFQVRDTDFGMNVGGGFMAQFNDHVGWRTDVRYFRALNTQNSTSDFDLAFGNFKFWRATGGLSFSF